MRNYKCQLRSLITGAAIAAVGGVVFVTLAGTTAKADLFSPTTSLEIVNPQPLVNGSFDFNVADDVAAVDLYIQSPTGHFIVVKDLKASGNASINIDTSQSDTTLVIPFNAADQAGDAAETPTGFVLPGAVQPAAAINVAVVDATETIDVGTLSTDAGDADGFLDGASVATLGYVKGSLAFGSVTLGADLKAATADAGASPVPEQNVSRIGKQVTYTLSAGSDTAAGFIILPVRLPVASL